MENSNEKNSNRYMAGIIGGLFGAIPGIILWIVLSLLGFNAGIMGFIIIGGVLLGYKRTGASIDKIGMFFCLILNFIIIGILTCSIEAYYLRKDYSETMKKDFMTEIKDVFLDSLKSSGLSDEEINTNLKDKYGIDGLDDTKGIDKLIKKMQDDTYMSERGLTKVPDTFIKSYQCLNDYIKNDTSYTDSFFSSLLVGFAFSILGFVTISNSTFMSPQIYND